MGEALSLVCKTITVYNDWRLESSLVRVYFGAQVFSGGGCGLEVASDLLRTSGKSIAAVIFYHHHLQQHEYLKKHNKASGCFL